MVGAIGSGLTLEYDRVRPHQLVTPEVLDNMYSLWNFPGKGFNTIPHEVNTLYYTCRYKSNSRAWGGRGVLLNSIIPKFYTVPGFPSLRASRTRRESSTYEG